VSALRFPICRVKDFDEPAIVERTTWLCMYGCIGFPSDPSSGFRISASLNLLMFAAGNGARSTMLFTNSSSCGAWTERPTRFPDATS
jgi:hypothetical protein